MLPHPEGGRFFVAGSATCSFFPGAFAGSGIIAVCKDTRGNKGSLKFQVFRQMFNNSPKVSSAAKMISPLFVAWLTAAEV